VRYVDSGRVTALQRLLGRNWLRGDFLVGVDRNVGDYKAEIWRRSMEIPENPIGYGVVLADRKLFRRRRLSERMQDLGPATASP